MARTTHRRFVDACHSQPEQRRVRRSSPSESQRTGHRSNLQSTRFYKQTPTRTQVCSFCEFTSSSSRRVPETGGRPQDEGYSRKRSRQHHKSVLLTSESARRANEIKYGKNYQPGE
jgi:hypothetical protein